MPTRAVHTVVCTPANTSDVTQAEALLHGEEGIAFGDAATGRAQASRSVDEELARRDATGQAAPTRPQQSRDAIVNEIERLKASIRAKVEHPFRVIKRQFGFTKVRYRGLAKNTAQITTLFALSNLWMVRKKLMTLTDESVRSERNRPAAGARRPVSLRNRPKITWLGSSRDIERVRRLQFDPATRLIRRSLRI